VLVIRDSNFNNFLNIINGEEEIEEIKFKLKRKKDEPKRFYSYKIKINKNLEELKGELIEHKPHFKSVPFDSPFSITPEKYR
jgi:hypothetical protein